MSNDTMGAHDSTGIIKTDFLSYSLGATVTPRLKVFQNIPLEAEANRKGSDMSQYSDLFDDLSDETDVSDYISNSRRCSLMSFASESEDTLLSDEISNEDLEVESPKKVKFYNQFVTELV